MKKMIKYISKWKIKHTSSINGYATWLALLCFMILIHFVSYVCAYSYERSYLLACQKQSHVDLIVMDAAKVIIEHNQFVQRCHVDGWIDSKKVMADDLEIDFKDEKTRLHAYCQNLHYIFYYDMDSIVNMEVEKDL